MRRRAPSLPAALAAAALAAGGCGPTDPGERIWARKCAACHGREGRGDTRFARGRPYAVLTDDTWKHGGDLDSIRRLVAEGDPASPMPAYRGRLGPDEIEAVSRHVLVLWSRAHGQPAPERR
ncbi:MAG TPA: c-type cytochrome [Thermoanaerobaculia bacterium]|nr:c-type cytochrome [Thermoanaerobaculia bacterium]